MFLLKKKILAQLNCPSDGPRLSAYVKAPDLKSMDHSLEAVYREAKRLLSPRLETRDLESFLEPLVRFKRNSAQYKSVMGNLGLFLTKNSFRVVRIPIEVEPVCVVAKSFHIKPLLKWALSDTDYYLLGLSERSANFYRGSLHGLSRAETFFYPDPERFDERTVAVLSEWLKLLPIDPNIPLFMAGEPHKTELFGRQTTISNFVRRSVGARFSAAEAHRALGVIRAVVRGRFQRQFGAALIDYQRAERLGMAEHRLAQIAKAAVEGRVKTLFVAEDRYLWGALDESSGTVEIHARQLDSEDDDILDDLAEIVMKKGGKVVIGRSVDLPEHRPLCAIVGPKGKR